MVSTCTFQFLHWLHWLPRVFWSCWFHPIRFVNPQMWVRSPTSKDWLTGWWLGGAGIWHFVLWVGQLYGFYYNYPCCYQPSNWYCRYWIMLLVIDDRYWMMFVYWYWMILLVLMADILGYIMLYLYLLATTFHQAPLTESHRRNRTSMVQLFGSTASNVTVRHLLRSPVLHRDPRRFAGSLVTSAGELWSHEYV